MRKKSKLLWLVNGLLFAGAIILVGGAILGNKVLFEEIPEWYTVLLLALSMPWIIASCVFIIKYKEIPRFGLPSIKGSWAVVQALIGIILSSGVEIYAVYQLILTLYNLHR